MKKCLHQFLADTIAWPLSKLLDIYNDTLTRPNILLSMISGFIWLEGVSGVRFVLSYFYLIYRLQDLKRKTNLSTQHPDRLICQA